METAPQQSAEKTLVETVQGKIQEITKGEGIPSNVEVAQSIESLKPGYDVNRERLSDTGKQVTEELDRLIEDARRIFLEKNKDEDLQKAAVHASRASQIARRNELLTTDEGRKAMEQAREGVYSGVNFARLMVTSAEFRDELVEALGVIQQSLRRGGTSEKERRGISEGRTSTEGLKTTIPGTQSQGPEEEEEEEEWGSEDEEGGLGRIEGRERDQPGLEKASAKVEKHEPLSQNQLDKVAERFLRLIKRLQSNPEYQDSIRYLIERMRSAFELGGLHAERMEQQLQETSEGREFLSETRQTKDHAIRLIERWTESSLDPLFTQINQLNDQMVNDKETRSELNGLGNFVERNLSGRKLSDDEESILKEAKDRFGRVRERLLSHYNSRINRVLEELQYLRDTFSENQAGQVLAKDLNSLTRTLLYDEQGQPAVKVELIKDLEVLFSAFLRKVQFVPVPRVAVTDPDFDFVADDIVLNIRELTPKQMHLETITKVHDPDLEQAGQSAREGTETVTGVGGPGAVNVRRETSHEQKSSWTGTEHTKKEPIHLETFVRLHLKHIHSDLRNVKWYYNKKTGMIKEHDRGHADIKIYGKGMSIDLDLEPRVPVATAERPVGHAIELRGVKCKIHRMSLRLYESKHDWIYTFFKPIIKNQIRSAIEQNVEKYMTEYIKDLDRNATMAAVGQYPVTHRFQATQKEKELRESRERGLETRDEQWPVMPEKTMPTAVTEEPA